MNLIKGMLIFKSIAFLFFVLATLSVLSSNTYAATVTFRGVIGDDSNDYVKYLTPEQEAGVVSFDVIIWDKDQRQYVAVISVARLGQTYEINPSPSVQYPKGDGIFVTSQEKYYVSLSGCFKGTVDNPTYIHPKIAWIVARLL